MEKQDKPESAWFIYQIACNFALEIFEGHKYMIRVTKMSGANMHVVVTGAAGFLGSHLCEKLLNEGNHVTGVDNLITGKQENLRCSRFKSTQLRPFQSPSS